MSLLSMMATVSDTDIADIRSGGNDPRCDSTAESLPAVSASAATAAPAEGPALYVATDLRAWPTERPHWFRADVQIDDTAYRRLDPEYYAWLRSRMIVARRAHQAGEIDFDAYDELRAKFNAVHQWAVEHLGEAALAEAVSSLDTRTYRPPVAESEPPVHGNRKPEVASGSADAIALVDAIAEKAIALGWCRERLYAIGNGVFDPRRGLVCHLKPGDRIGEVTAQSIEIIHPPPAEVRHRFYNPDVDQPWIIRGEAQKK